MTSTYSINTYCLYDFNEAKYNLCLCSTSSCDFLLTVGMSCVATEQSKPYQPPNHSLRQLSPLMPMAHDDASLLPAPTIWSSLKDLWACGSVSEAITVFLKKLRSLPLRCRLVFKPPSPLPHRGCLKAPANVPHISVSKRARIEQHEPQYQQRRRVLNRSPWGLKVMKIES